MQVENNRLILEIGSLEVLATGSAAPVLQGAGLEFGVQGERTRASLYMSRSDVVSVSVDEGAITTVRPNGKKLQDVQAGQMVTLTNTRSDIKIDKRNAAADIAEVQAEQLRHMGAGGNVNPILRSKAGALLGTLVTASGGLIGASFGGSSALAGQGLGATSPGLGLAASAATSASYSAANMRKASQDVQQVMSDGLWGVTGCGAGCRFGVPIVTTHIFSLRWSAVLSGNSASPSLLIAASLRPSGLST